MAKRIAGDQITKDDYDPDDREPGGRDREEELRTEATAAVMSTRKIAKPRTRTGTPVGAGAQSLFQPASVSATPSRPTLGGLFGTPSNGVNFGTPAQTESKPNPFASVSSAKPLFNLFSTPSAAQNDALKSSFNFGATSTPQSTTTSSKSMFGNPAPPMQTDTPKTDPFAPSTSSNMFGYSTPAAKPTSNMFGASTPAAAAVSNMFSNSTATTPATNGMFGRAGATTNADRPTTPTNTGSILNFGGDSGSSTPKAPPPANLFGAPSTPAPASNPVPKSFFGAPSATPAPAPSKNLFGDSLFGKPSATSTPLKSPSKPDEMFSPAPVPLFNFGSTASKPEAGFTPQAAPASSLNRFGGSTALPQMQPTVVEAPKPTSAPMFGAGGFTPTGLGPPAIFAGRKVSTTTTTATQSSSFAASGFTPKESAAPSIFAGRKIENSSTPKPMPKPAPSITNGSNGTEKGPHNPRSLTPPAGSDLERKDMPHYNYLYQVKSLNKSIRDNVMKAFEKDPLGDWSAWMTFYREEIPKFDALRKEQERQIGGSSDSVQVDRSMADAPLLTISNTSSSSKAFASILGGLNTEQKDVSYPSLPTNQIPSFLSQNQSAESASGGMFRRVGATKEPETKPAPTFMFNSGDKPATPSGMFGGAFDGEDKENKAKDAPSMFGVQTNGAKSNMFGNPSPASSSQPSSIFTTALKPAQPSAFFFNSKPSSATPSNAPSPGGSVLFGGDPLKVNNGGWDNPFTTEKMKEKNPMFLTDDDDDDEPEQDMEDDDDDARDDGSPTDVDTTPDLSKWAPKNEEKKTSLFSQSGFTFGQPNASANSNAYGSSDTKSNLFGNHSSENKSVHFGAATPQRTGAVGLFGSSDPVEHDNRWTPDKPLVFGAPMEKLEAPKSSLFGSATPAFNFTGSTPSNSTTNGLFGSKPSLNFSFGQAPASSEPPKATSAAPSIFSQGFLAPPTTSAAPSPAASTPGASGASDAGGEEGEPSDEVQSNAKITDLSGAGPGEEDEDAKYDVRASIYQVQGSAYVKIGVGRLRVLKNRVNNRGRVVVKADIGKVLMNVALSKSLKYNDQVTEDNQKTIKVIEPLPAGQGIRIWVIKVGKAESGMELRQCLEENKG